MSLQLEGINFNPAYTNTEDTTIFAYAISQINAGLTEMVPIAWNRNPDGTPAFIGEPGMSPKKDMIPLIKWNSDPDKGGYKGQPIDALTFRTAWSRGGTAIGVRTGRRSRLYLFDFDTDADTTLPKFLDAVGGFLNNDQVYLERTVSNGFHLIVKLADGERWDEKDDLRDEAFAYYPDVEKPVIESRGEGGMVFVAPSRGYRMIDGFAKSLVELKPITRGDI